MVDPVQVRMARAALNWSHGDLARAAAVHRNTISNFETGKFVADRRRLAAMRRALESAGVEFIADDGDGSGVRLRKCRPTPVAVEDLNLGVDGLRDVIGAGAAMRDPIGRSVESPDAR